MIHSRYSDKVVLITGGGGMGRAAALRILDESGKVVLTDCSPTVLKNLEQEFDALGYSDRILFLQSDVRQYTDCCAVVRHGIEVFKKIDVLVTTAGILRHHPIDELTEDDWKDVIDINLTGTYHSVKSLIGHMKERRYGRIVLISSIGGRTGRPGVLCSPRSDRRRNVCLSSGREPGKTFAGNSLGAYWNIRRCGVCNCISRE